MAAPPPLPARVILEEDFAEVVVSEVPVAAIQLFMWIYTLLHVLQAPRDVRTARIPYIAVGFILLSLSCAAAVLGAFSSFTALLEVDLLDSQSSISTIHRVYRVFGIKCDGLKDIAIAIGNGLLVFRCAVIWSDRRWVSALPISLYVAMLAIGITQWAPLPIQGKLDVGLGIALISLSVLINVTVTTLISLRLLQGHKRLRDNLPLSSHTLYLGAISVLVEAAAPVAFFGVGHAILFSIKSSSDGVLRMKASFAILYQVFAALAPQLIIFRVATGKSWTRRGDSHGTITGDIRFAEAPACASTDEENLSLPK